MSDNQKDVLIAAYLFEDLAKKDFDAVLKLAEDKAITVEGVVLVQKDAEGEVHVTETGDHLGRKGAKLGGGVGLVVGLFAPPLLAATAVGAAAGGVTGKFAKHRLESGIGEKMDAALPPGSGGVIAIYDSDGHDAVDAALANAVKKSVAQIDGTGRQGTQAGPVGGQAGRLRRRSATAELGRRRDQRGQRRAVAVGRQRCLERDALVERAVRLHFPWADEPSRVWQA